MTILESGVEIRKMQGQWCYIIRGNDSHIVRKSDYEYTSNTYALEGAREYIREHGVARDEAYSIDALPFDNEDE